MSPYGHHWRTIVLPALRVRASYACERCDLPDRPSGLRSALDGAHLDGDTSNNDDMNLALLCRRCHRAADYPSWSAKFTQWLIGQRDERVAKKDAARPILAYLEEAS
ncbi:MAG: hypothetical protein ACLPX8_02745 [Bryobacteraceae bacterium]|jgi:hypothetical protein